MVSKKKQSKYNTLTNNFTNNPAADLVTSLRRIFGEHPIWEVVSHNFKLQITFSPLTRPFGIFNLKKFLGCVTN